MPQHLNPYATPYTPKYNYTLTDFCQIITYVPNYTYQGTMRCAQNNIFYNYKLSNFVPVITYTPVYTCLLDINKYLPLTAVDPAIVDYATKQVDDIVNQTLYY
jgi:hypothetical protein